jgi:hypothetical protein
MAKISELNKKERDLRNTLENLKREYRKNQISKNDYDKAVGEHKKGLDKISEEKSKLIGKPPIPPAPGRDMLSEIKRGIMADKSMKPAPKKPEKKTVKPSVSKPAPKPPAPKPVEKPAPKPPAVKPFVKPAPKPAEKPKPAPKPPPKPPVEAAPKPPAKPAAKPDVKPAEEKPPKPPVREAAPKTIAAKEPAKPSKDIPSVEDSQNRISRALKIMGEETDAEAIKKVFEETQKEFLTFLVEVKRNRQRIQELENLFSEVNEIRKKFNAMDFKGMTDEIYRQFERMNSVVKDNESKIEELVSRDESRIGALEKKLDEIAASLTSIPAVEEVKRDLEVIRQKVEWLEKSRQEVDVQPVMDMVKELHEKLESLKVRAPYIIE